MIRGSGVEPARFTASPLPEGVPIVVLPTRMLVDKGVHEFVAAARELTEAGVRARFVLVGDSDPNPAAIPRQDLERWDGTGVIEWWGHRGDMPDVYRLATIVCLPSYREGLPKVLLEAQASGRPVITTDVPGCRDAITPDSGLLVPPKDAASLSAAIRELLADPDRMRAMGRAGRTRVEVLFDAATLATETVNVYDMLLGRHAPASTRVAGAGVE